MGPIFPCARCGSLEHMLCDEHVVVTLDPAIGPPLTVPAAEARIYPTRPDSRARERQYHFVTSEGAWARTLYQDEIPRPRRLGGVDPSPPRYESEGTWFGILRPDDENLPFCCEGCGCTEAIGVDDGGRRCLTCGDETDAEETASTSTPDSRAREVSFGELDARIAIADAAALELVKSQLAAAEARVRELEVELADMRKRLDRAADNLGRYQ